MAARSPAGYRAVRRWKPWSHSGPTTDQRHQFKVFKRVEEVVEDDLPPAWLKDALMVDEEASFDCC